uniref:Mitochondrial import inner membrane translocase subunit n=1 Tax=Hyaloperonospora arabidopsidis (strain Emoy2) TaxID=559515 RepID=M4C105_HYAAE
MEGANFTPQQKTELVNRQQALQELTQNLQEKCFDKCISRPSGKLDGKQQNCLALCINRYIDTMKVVSEAMVQRGPQEKKALGGVRQRRGVRHGQTTASCLLVPSSDLLFVRLRATKDTTRSTPKYN